MNKKIRKSSSKNKAQLKIQEMAFVLLAVVFLFSLVFLIFVAFNTRFLSKVAGESREMRAITMLEVIASLPELRCSSSFSTVSEAVCLDYDKVLAFSNSRDLKNKYAPLWKNAFLKKIVVEEVYPPQDRRVYEIYSESINSKENVKVYSTYVALCLEDYVMKCKIAKIKATLLMPENK